MVMIGFGLGGVFVGRAVDRFGVVLPLAVTTIALGLSFGLASRAQSYWVFNAVHVLIGAFGCAAVFSPLIADISKWFTARRGLAVAICASGNYLSGAIWPGLLYRAISEYGWRETYALAGIVSVAAMLPLLLLLRRKPYPEEPVHINGGSAGNPAGLGLSPTALMALLCIAGVGCCMAMAMPQVHLVSLCGDLGFGPARGAEMLSTMLACGIVSRLVFGHISDRLGGLRTLLISSLMQAVALLMFLPADTLVSLYLAAALFGLFQGGIVPCYALIVREFFPASEAGNRLGIVILATIVGMAIGGWISGAIFDWTGSYTVAFIHGIGWNLVNLSVALFLLSRSRGPLIRALTAS
jgi:MFS family permease